MAITYTQKKRRQTNILYIIATAILILSVFLLMVSSFYIQAKEDAHETLHIQTKQIKDDIVLQINSDMENLTTMANFAAKLHIDGQDYSRMFDSFKPIGLYSRIGILTPDCAFITKDGTYDLYGKISYADQLRLGQHVTGRTYSYSIPDEEVVRCSVPILANGQAVGIMYGIVKIEDINKKYNTMAAELDAQLFVYDKESGKFIIDTINSPPGELSELKNREYNDGYSYEDFINNDKGFSSFKSIRTGEDLFLHYSIIEDFNWGIMLARYETQVFAKTHKTSQNLLITFIIVVAILVIYLQLTLKTERIRTMTTTKSSEIRKLLLEVNEQYTNITEAMKNITEFSSARSSFFEDTDGETYHYIQETNKQKLLPENDRKYLCGELFGYAAKVHNANNSSFGYMSIVPNNHMLKTNPDLHNFMTRNGFKNIDFSVITEQNNHVSILGTINAKSPLLARKLIEDVAICFSIAIYNKKNLNRTELAATTDSLTGTLNRVAYKKDIRTYDIEKPEEFSCIYIDVNELHIRNNKYGHAAGDEMLIYIANTLKEIFFGHNIYRMGGDEFLVFAKNITQDHLNDNLCTFKEQLKHKGYHVAIGTSYRSMNTNCEEMVREAEVRMYEAKAKYYQDKKQLNISENDTNKYILTKTGIDEIDTMISVLKENYNGIYKVSLEDDSAHRILMPSYLGYKENEEHFSKLYMKYVDEFIHPDYHRAAVSFLNYDAIRKQLYENKTPSITYKKIDGETVTLSIYKISGDSDNLKYTLWVFAKK